MLGRIILSILFIPINALLLWTVVSLIGERESYNKALLTAALFFIISLLSFISFSGFYASIFSYFLTGWGTTILCFFVLWGFYRYDFWSLLGIWFIWAILQIPFNVLQTKILNLPWDNFRQCF